MFLGINPNYSFAINGGGRTGDQRCDHNTNRQNNFGCDFNFALTDMSYQAYAFSFNTHIDNLLGGQEYLRVDACLSTNGLNSTTAACVTAGPGVFNGGTLDYGESSDIDLGDLTGYNFLSIHVEVSNMNTNTSYELVGRKVDIDLNASQTTITQGNSSQITWSSSDANTPGNVVLSGPSGSITSGYSGSVNVSPSSTSTYTLQAYGPGADAAGNAGWISRTVTINVNPTPIITNPPPGCSAPGAFNLNNTSCQNGQIPLSWSASSCAASYDVYERQWTTGSWNKLTTTGGTSFTANPPADVGMYYFIRAVNSQGTKDSNTIYGGTCAGGGGGGPGVPEADIRCNGLSGSCSISSGSSATITWCGGNSHDCANAVSCQVKRNDGVLIATGVSGSFSIGPLTSSISGNLTCLNSDGGSRSSNIAINVQGGNPPLDMDLRVNGQDHSTSGNALQVNPGSDVYFTWTSSGNSSRTCSTYNGSSGWTQSSVPPNFGDYNSWQATGYRFTAPSTVGTYQYSAICQQDTSLGINKVEQFISFFIHYVFAAIISDNDSVFVEVAFSPSTPAPTNSPGSVSDFCDVLVLSPTPPPPPSADIKCNNSNGPCNVDWNQSAVISWCGNSPGSTCANSNSCSVTKNGTLWANGTSGSLSTGINSPGTYDYLLTCAGEGLTSDTVKVVVDLPVPTTSNITITEPNYCVSGPAVTVGWTYSDPAGSAQSGYQVQITKTGGFNNPVLDTGKINSNSNNYFTGQGVLEFNTIYKARVRTWNSFDSVSNWSNTSNTWKTPPYAYPQVDFNWTANGILNNPSPPVNKPVTFTDQTVFNGNSNGRKWSWLFGDGGSSTTQNPSHIYSTEGSYYVTLTATDNTNQSCARTKGPLIIQKPVPQWREVAPR